MDFLEIKNKRHYLYDSIEEFKAFCPDMPTPKDWRDAGEGEWALLDDHCVCMILKKFQVTNIKGKKVDCVRTVCGSYRSDTDSIAGEVSGNIYTFGSKGGKRWDNIENPNQAQKLFIHYMACGNEAAKAFKKAYPNAKNEEYIKKSTAKLLKSKEISNMVDEEKRKILQGQEVSPDWAVKELKDIVENKEGEFKSGDRLGALRDLAKMCGLFETEEKKTEQLSVWAGFTPDQIDSLKNHNPKELVAHVEKEHK